MNGTPSSLALFARRVVEEVVRGGHSEPAPPGEYAAAPHGGVFVTLRILGQLRGCMGTLDDRLPLFEAIRRAATNAATGDPRFPPVAPGELQLLNVEVSLLSAPRRIGSPAELAIGRDGVMIRRGEQRGLFLPQVAIEHHLDAEAFVSRCCSEKAGLNAEAWRDGNTEMYAFTTDVAHDPPPK